MVIRCCLSDDEKNGAVTLVRTKLRENAESWTRSALGKR